MRQPTSEQVARYLKYVHALDKFEATQKIIRGATAFSKEEWPDRPDESIVAVHRWLTELSNGKEPI